MVDPWEGSTDVATVFYPGVLDLSGATPIDTYAAADIRDMNFTIAETAVGHSIRGRVVNPMKGAGDRVVSLRLDRENRAMAPVVIHLREGTDAFEFKRVPTGSYTLTAEWLRRDDRYTARHSLVVGASDLEGVKLTVAKGAAIAGTLRTRQRDTIPAGAVRLQLQSIELSPGSNVTGEVKNGRFSFPEMPADRYRLSLTGQAA